jgi:hypothetical protein
MSNLTVLVKIKERVKHIPYNELLKSIISNPVGVARDFNNLDTILDSKEVINFTNPEQLLLFIEEKSRQLDCISASTRLSNEKRIIKEKFKEQEKIKEEKSELFFSIMESQGFKGSKNSSECLSCGVIVTANGLCKC